jgi:hypothetical protein
MLGLLRLVEHRGGRARRAHHAPRGPGRRRRQLRTAAAGLLLWAGLHGIVTLHNDRHNAPWPPLDELLVHLIALHTWQEPDVIAKALRVTTADH